MNTLPEVSDIDILVIMGGPMNVFDFHIHPWMQEEIDFVSRYIESGKPLLGICLGAQIIAASLGVDVYPGDHKEIGWHNLQFLPSLGDYKIWDDLPRHKESVSLAWGYLSNSGGSNPDSRIPGFPKSGFHL